ncbi:sensor histidine kinase [Paenibacillus sp. J5C_2022]|uniref:cache domain-containing sensor histidine kinase n=1 Tax=Paenibacillus sp. J5C2022 TaxID=2977129 RepID=UPI0021D260EA|nr:sensor histidine kinase [Paenibacillus sp. J5C2022]MCU6712965.1 sensor histidine kinase [Paenibacillus sp. J5C2022]
MFARFYRNRIRNSLFGRWILLFSAIAVMSIVTLAYGAHWYLSQSMLEKELDSQKKTMDAVNDYVTRKYEAVHNMVENIYRNQTLSEHSSFLLQNTFDAYIQHKLDRYFEFSGEAVNVISYFDNAIDDDPSIEHLLLYSTEKQYMYVFKQNGPFKLVETGAGESYIPDAMALEAPPVDLPNPWLLKALQLSPRERGLVSIRVPINDKNTYKNIGRLAVLYRTDAIDQIVRRVGGDMKGTILVLSADGYTLFDSSGTYTGMRHPEADVLQSLDAEERLKEDALFTKLTNSHAGYTVVGMSSKAEVAKAHRGLSITILLIAVVSVLIVVTIPSAMVVNYAKRTGKIIRFMRKVESGELSPRIADDKDDELGQISRSFNEMLDELTLYIDRVYKAEIREKQTELAALQARVNPHFLYNTLEVIRMRALSQGAEDAAEMIYSLSALFRNIVRDKPSYSVKEEVEMCRLYLELFRIRYKDKFSYRIAVGAGAGSAETMKLILQPIIENYIVHGMRKDSDDNEIVITADREGDTVHIQVRDNGIGIAPRKLEGLRAALLQPDAERTEGSFGMRSVHERLRLVYGEAGGLTVSSREGEGTIISLHFPVKKGEQGIYV